MKRAFTNNTMIKSVSGVWSVLMIFLLAISAPCSAAETPLNVIMIMADDVGYECFGSYGSKTYKTPRLDALAEKGIRFEHCHSTPLCTPSRVNLLSGKSNVFNYENFQLYPKKEPTFANYFQKNGYKTAVAGKWQLYRGPGRGTSAKSAGFDEYCLWNYPGTKNSRYWNPTFNINGESTAFTREDFGPKVATDFLIDFINRNKSEPFLAYYPMILPHGPTTTTPDSVNRSEEDKNKRFVDMVNYLDKCVGRIEDCLIELGIREKTLIIFTGDNGSLSGYPSEMQDGTFVKGGKGETRDNGTHVPLIVNLPGTIASGQVNSDLICFSDFFPTMVEAAGLPPKEISNGNGVSYWPQCLGEKGHPRETIYLYYFPSPHKKGDKARNQSIYVRDKRYKLYANGKLYDTQNDILEESPLEITEKLFPVVEKLRKEMAKFPEKGMGIDWDAINTDAPSK